MKSSKIYLLLGLAIFILLITLSIHGFLSAQKPVELTDADCIKCHQKEVSFINTSGGKHKNVGCLSCHMGHFPNIPKEQMIPKCNMCHSGKEHYNLENCLTCHQNPHTPLNISFEGKEFKKECASCHSNPLKEMNNYPSKHANLSCNFCHSKHKEKPECLSCHQGHLPEQTAKDCLSCHRPHKPLKVTYEMETPNKFCTACHQKVGLNLNQTQTKHKNLACAFCHRQEHKSKPACITCHGSPHPKEMLAKFKGCLDCHNDPHLLIK